MDKNLRGAWLKFGEFMSEILKFYFWLRIWHKWLAE